MRKKKQAVLRSAIDTPNSFIYWLIIAIAAFFLFISPYYKGLFNGGNWVFEGPIYKSLIWCSILLFAISIFFIFRWKLKDFRDVLGIWVWLIPVSYLLSTINAVSMYSSINSVMIHVLYATFFTIGLYFTRSRWSLIIVVQAIVVSGYMWVVYGLFNWFGSAHFVDAVLGNRLSNVFQYPNTYAAYLIGLFFCSVLLASISKRWSLVVLHSSMLVPILLSFFLTLSRGALLVMLAVVVIYLFVLPLKKQIVHLMIIFSSTIATMSILHKISNYRNMEGAIQGNSSGWYLIILVSIIVSILVVLIKKYIEPRLLNGSQNVKILRLTNAIIPGLFIVIALIGLATLTKSEAIVNQLPASIMNRIESINTNDESFQTRKAYYVDSIEIIKDYPLLGAGGGAWSNLYTVYQSYPYTSHQAHNFFLQHLIETGWVGFIILMGLLLFVFASYFRSLILQNEAKFEYERNVYFIVASTFLIHSIIDFNMSYVYVGLLVFLCLGGMVSNEGLLRKIDFSKMKGYWSKLFPVALGIISILLLIYSVRYSIGNSRYIAAIQQGGSDYYQISNALDRALDTHANHPFYVATKLELLNQAYNQTNDTQFYTEAKKILEEIKEDEPYNLLLLDREFSLFSSKRDMEQLENLISYQLSTFPWNVTHYERMITLKFELGYHARQEGSLSEGHKHWQQALDLYTEVQTKLDHIQTLSSYQQNESKEFFITPQIKLVTGKIHYLNQDFNEASKVLRTGMSGNITDQIEREITRWYIASLIKQGIADDTGMYKLLIEDEATEEYHIQQIVDLVS